MNSKEKIQTLQDEIASLKRMLLVAERARFDLIKQNASSEQKDASLLAAGVAHEFNNIIGSLGGLAEWALESGKVKDLKEALEYSLVACARSSQISKALQGFAQPREEERSLFNIQKLADDLKKIFSLELKKKTLKLEFSNDDLKTSIYSHSIQLTEILVNLVKNAIESSGSSKVKVFAQKEKHSIKILVQDNGPGIPKIYQEKIFQAFFTTKGVMGHLQKEKTSNKGGSGLGLFLSLRLAHENSCELKLVQSSAKGTLFALTIPVSVG